MPVRSSPLFHGLLSVSEDEAEVEVVPSGHTWIVKDVVARNGGFGSQFIEVYVRGPDSEKGFLFSQSLVDLGVAHFVGQLVAAEGHVLCYTSNGQDFQLWVSGSDLIGVA